MGSADELFAEETTEETTATATTDNSVAEPEEELFGVPDEELEDETPSTSGDDTSAAETKEPEAPATEAAAHRVDEQLLADAELVGFTREEAESMTPQALEKSIRVALRNVAMAKRDAVERMVQEPELEEFKIDLDPAEYDEKVIATFQKMKEHYDKQLADVNERTRYAATHAQQVEQQARRRFEQEFTSKFDADVAAIGLEDVLGKGTVSEIRGNDTAFKNRLRVLEHMEMDAARYLNRGDQPPDQDVLFKRAIHAEFGDRLIQKQQQELSSKVEKRAGQILPKPRTSNRERKLTGFAAVKDKYREILRSDEATSLDEIFAE